MPAPRRTGPRLSTLALTVLVLLLPSAGIGIASAGAVAAHAGPAMWHGPGRSTATQSTNWAGWAVSTGNGAVSNVWGSWIVPKIQGTCPRQYQYSSFWIGIDGYSSNSVEQTGTDSDCQGGSPVYYGWYEFYPNPSHVITKITVHPGDVMSAQVHYAGGKFTITLKDVTTSVSASKSSTVSGNRSSAEWIAEAPSSGAGILPLADFGTVHFGTDATGVTGTDYATISGTKGTIGSFAGTAQITMISNSGTTTKASPSALTPDGTSFNVTWKNAGP